MRRPVFVLALLAVLLAPALIVPRTVEACSAGEDFDAVAESEIILAGRVVDMRIADEYQQPTTSPPGSQTFAPVWLDFQVDRYFKGDGPRHLSALDGASVAFMNNETSAERARFEGALYWGGGGSCGALDGDPRGMYWVTGLSLHEGVYRTNRILLFGTGVIGSGPDDPAVIERIAELADRLGPGVTPAATGHGLVPTTDRGLVLTLAALALAALVGARSATGQRRA